VFEELKMKMSELPRLHAIDYKLLVVLRVDASNIGVGAYFCSVKDDGVELPILFWSHKFSDAATRWHTITQEAFAIFPGMNTCRDLLLGHTFTLQTDHRNLLYMNKSESKTILAWFLHLGNFSFIIEHIPGKDNVLADALSRLFEISQEVEEGRKESDWLQEEVQKVITIVNRSRYIQKKDAATTPIENTAMH